MADNIRVGDDYEVFGLSGNDRQEVLRVIQRELGWEFAQYVEDVLTVNASNIADGLDDIIIECERFDPETDDIREVLNDIRISAEYTKGALEDFY